MQCAEVMTTEPTYCVPEDPVSRVAKVMKIDDVGAVPICDGRQGNRLVGIVTDRDLALNIVAYARDPNATKIEDVMTREPFSCRADDDVEKALDSMSLYQVRRIPVVGKGGELVGIISQADVATRIHRPEKAAAVLGHISSPSTLRAA